MATQFLSSSFETESDDEWLVILEAAAAQTSPLAVRQTAPVAMTPAIPPPAEKKTIRKLHATFYVALALSCTLWLAVAQIEARAEPVRVLSLVPPQPKPIFAHWLANSLTLTKPEPELPVYPVYLRPAPKPDGSTDAECALLIIGALIAMCFLLGVERMISRLLVGAAEAHNNNHPLTTSALPESASSLLGNGFKDSSALVNKLLHPEADPNGWVEHFVGGGGVEQFVGQRLNTRARLDMLTAGAKFYLHLANQPGGDSPLLKSVLVLPERERRDAQNSWVKLHAEGAQRSIKLAGAGRTLGEIRQEMVLFSTGARAAKVVSDIIYSGESPAAVLGARLCVEMFLNESTLTGALTDLLDSDEGEASAERRAAATPERAANEEPTSTSPVTMRCEEQAVSSPRTEGRTRTRRRATRIE